MYGDVDRHRRPSAPTRRSGSTDFVADPPAASAPWGWTTGCGTFSTRRARADPASVDGKLGEPDAASAPDRVRPRRRADPRVRRAARHEPTGRRQRRDRRSRRGARVAGRAPRSSRACGRRSWAPADDRQLLPAQPGRARRCLQRLTSSSSPASYSLEELLVAIVDVRLLRPPPPEAAAARGRTTIPAIYDPWVTARLRSGAPANGAGRRGRRARRAHPAVGRRRARSSGRTAAGRRRDPVPVRGRLQHAAPVLPVRRRAAARPATSCAAGGDGAARGPARHRRVPQATASAASAGWTSRPGWSGRSAFGACAKPAGGTPDFIDDLLMTARRRHRGDRRAKWSSRSRTA